MVCHTTAHGAVRERLKQKGGQATPAEAQVQSGLLRRHSTYQQGSSMGLQAKPRPSLETRRMFSALSIQPMHGLNGD